MGLDTKSSVKYFIRTFIAILLIGCAGSGKHSSTSSGWQSEYSPSVILKQSGSGFYFDFPKEDGIHYITKVIAGHAVTPKEIVAVFKITGTPDAMFQATRDTGAFPAHVRLYFSGGTQWWSNPISYVLETSNDTVTLTVPVDPREWTDVWGKPATEMPQIFYDGWKNDGKIGMTFGASGFGHGVYLTKGAARFTLFTLTVN